MTADPKATRPGSEPEAVVKRNRVAFYGDGQRLVITRNYATPELAKRAAAAWRKT